MPQSARELLARLAPDFPTRHAGHGVDAQPVDVEFLEPVQRVGQKKIAHLMALLFPGAGHPDKTWLQSSLEGLARELSRRGIEPRFVLGPVEMERGIALRGGDSLRPRNLEELAAAIRSARFVVGPDCGPLHLAAMAESLPPGEFRAITAMVSRAC